MKNKNILIILVIANLAGACSLEKLPENLVPEDNFYKSQSDFEQAVNGIYAPLQAIYSNHWKISELRSDNTYFAYNSAQRGSQPWEDMATFTQQSNNGELNTNWSNNYLIISRANKVLSTIDNVTFDEAVKGNLKGQAFFLRALAYYDLVRNFSGVPLFTQPAEDYAGTFKNRSPADSVYAQIVADANAAAGLLPAKSGQTTGRPGSGAAYTLLGSVYITLARWNDAETALKQVQPQGYALLPDYASIFDPKREYNSEMIFEVGYLSGTPQNLASAFPYLFIPLLTNPGLVTGLSNESPRDYGSFNTPTPDLIAAYEDTVRDTRYKASIAYFTGPSPLPGFTYNHFPYIKKYLFPHELPGQTDQNWPIFRYAEVLLMLAESLNEQNKAGEALPFLNQVRQRAGLPDITITDKVALRAAILHERQIELAFEDKRWYDLVRTGLAVSTMNNFGAKVKAGPAKYYYPVGGAPTGSSFMVDNNKLILPIPVTEIIINPNLKQNPGY